MAKQQCVCGNDDVCPCVCWCQETVEKAVKQQDAITFLKSQKTEISCLPLFHEAPNRLISNVCVSVFPCTYRKTHSYLLVELNAYMKTDLIIAKIKNIYIQTSCFLLNLLLEHLQKTVTFWSYSTLFSGGSKAISWRTNLLTDKFPKSRVKQFSSKTLKVTLQRVKKCYPFSSQHQFLKLKYLILQKFHL